MKLYQSILLLCVVFLFAIYMVYWNNKLTENQDSIKTHVKYQYEKTIDSLQNELFIKGMELGRYQTALEILKEEDNKSAIYFEKILHNKTE